MFFHTSFISNNVNKTVANILRKILTNKYIYLVKLYL